MAVPLWDMVGKVANLAQLLGLDAVTLITIAMSLFLQFHHVNKKECRKLEERVRKLRVHMSLVDGHYWITQQNDMELLAGLVQVTTNVLREATDLVESYKRSTLYARVRGGRGMATRFRDLRIRVDSCCHLIVTVNAFLLVVQMQTSNQNHPPPSSSLVRTEGNEVGVPPSAGDSVDAGEPSSTAAPDDTHVIDVTPVLPARND